MVLLFILTDRNRVDARDSHEGVLKSFLPIQSKTVKKLLAFSWLILNLILFSGSTLWAQTSLTTYHNDQARDGWNQSEITLTTANVNHATFGKLFSNAVDGQVYAQPLYMPNISIGGGTHNVVYVVTEHDSAYAFDADNAGVTYWHDTFIGGVTMVISTAADAGGCPQVTPEIGITDTPVIDPATGTMYFVAMTKVVSGGVTTYLQQLHAVDISTGNEKFNSPTTIQAVDPKNAAVTFIARAHKERCALTLSNGVVYTAFTSHCDFNTWGAYHGWVIGYNASNISQQMSVYNTTPTGTNPEGSLWESGDGPSVDAAGNLYFLTSNGNFDQTAPVTDYGQCFLKLNTAGNAVTALDYFSPMNEATMSAADDDVGSAGQCLLPASWGSAAHPNLVIGADKPGDLYVVDTANMGHFSATTNNVPQTVAAIGGRGYTTPAIYSNGVTKYVYWGMTASPLKTFTFANGVYVTPASSQSTATFGGQGCVPSVSSNGNSNGIVWGLANGTPVVLHAYDATNLGTELYNSTQNATRDSAVGAVVKFAPPSIVNGKVYVPTANSLVVYGLLITPTFTPTGSFTATPTVTPTRTNTATNTSTRTATNTPSRTPSATVTNSPTNTVANTSTNSPTATASRTPTPSPTQTGTSTPPNSPTRTPTNSPTNTPVNTATNTSVNTTTRTPTLTPSNSATNTTTNSPTSTPSNSPTRTPTNSPTNTMVNTATNTPVNTATRTLTSTATSSPTNSATATPTITPSNTATRTPTNSSTPSPSNSPTLSSTPTISNTATNTPLITNTSSNTPTVSPTSTPTSSPTRTTTATPSNSPANTSTNTPTNSFTLTWTNTLTLTATKTATQTPTVTATNSPSSKPVITNTVSNTLTNTPTLTPTWTATLSPTSTFTRTATKSPTLTLTNTATNSPVNTATFTPISVTVSVVSGPGAPSNGTKLPGASNVLVDQVVLSNPSSSTVTLTNLTITNTGTGIGSTGITNITLSNNGTPLGTISFATNTAAFTGLNLVIGAGASVTLQANTNFSVGAPSGTTYTFQISGMAGTNGQAANFNGLPYTGATVTIMTATATSTSTATNSPTITPIPSATFTNTPTNTFTPTTTPSPTATITPTQTFSPTLTATPNPAATSVPVLYPNPAPGGGSTNLQLTLGATSDVHYRIFTLSFRKVQDQTIPNVPAGLNNLKIPLVDKSGVALANGLYYLVINYDGKRVVLKLLVMG